jgi:hypothetical protein
MKAGPAGELMTVPVAIRWVVPLIVLAHLSPTQRRAYVIAHNKLAR